jgi:hypothetical protein
MKIFRIGSMTVGVALTLFSLATPIGALAAQVKEKVLIDFTSFRRDPDGTTFRPYEYAYGSWDKHVVDLKGRGTLIKASDGKGGLGENKTMIDFSKSPMISLSFVIGSANQAKGMNFSLEDKDGTEETWWVPLENKTSTPVTAFRFELSKSDVKAKPGTTAGLNLKKISTWQIRGDYTDAKVEALLVKLVAEIAAK